MGHIRLDSIQSNGSSYIDTGYVAKSENYRIKMQFYRGPQYGGTLFGIVGSDEDALSVVISNPVTIVVGGSTIVFDSITFEEYTMHSIDLHVNNGSVSVTFDGVTYNSTYTGAINKTLSMYLCACNAENTAVNISPMCSFATCQIYDDDELVRDYIAAQDEDGYIGFYESISKVLYRSPFDSFVPTTPIGYIPDNKSELTPIEYVESTGSQIVYTCLFASDETRTVCDFEFTGDNESEGISFLFGSVDYFQGAVYGFCAENGTDTFKAMTGFTGAEGMATFDYDRHTVSLSSKETLFDGTKVYGDTYEDFYVRRLSITFFGTFFQGTPYGFSKAKMYSCKIYENDLLVADFKPYAYMGVAGLYNSVDNTLYFSITDSQLIAGPKAVETLDFESQPFGFRRRLLLNFDKVDSNNGILPSGYTQLEYIESGGEQIIDTLYNPTQDTGVMVDAKILGSDTDSNVAYLWSSGSYKVGYGTDDNKPYWGYPYGGGFVMDAGNILNVRRLYDWRGTMFLIDRIVYVNIETYTSVDVNPIILFGRRSYDGTLQNSIKARLYSCKIYERSTVVRDFIPCRNPAGVYGLYDMVEEKFYSNQGTGQFTGA